MRIDTVPQLLSTIEQLPSAARRSARQRVEAAVALPAPAARAALGLLALDLAAPQPEPARAPGGRSGASAEDVVLLPELVGDAAGA